MRITGGDLRGRVLPGRVPMGVRPTASRVREALFSMVGQDLRGWSVIDAFGGTGLLGFEAASRGAGPVLIVERRPATARQIASAAAALGLDALSVRVGDAARVLPEGSWDLVLLDPPYADDAARWVRAAAASARRALVMEHRAGVALPPEVGALGLDRARSYGDSALSVYRPRTLAGLEEAPVIGEDLGVVEGER